MRQTKAPLGAHSKFQLMVGAAFAAVTLCGAPAFAQDEAGASETGEIVVTAQRRAEALEDVPISIANVSSETLESMSINDVMSLPQAVPALRITRAGTFVQPSIRGIGSQVALPGLPQNVTTYIDGYYVPTAGATNFSLINIDSVNVLKGPQGTLFGFNTTGGAIQINTRRPQFDTNGFARVGYGENNTASFGFYGTTGLSDQLAVDLATAYEQSDGYVTNIVTGDDEAGAYDQWYFRTQFLLEPTDDISFRIALAHSEENDPRTQNVIARDGISIAAPIPGAVITTERGQISHNEEGYAKFTSDSLTITSTIDLGPATLTSYTGYREDTVSQGLDYEASSEALNFSYWRVPDRTFTQEVNLASNDDGDDRLSWVLGGFYMRTQDDYDYNTNGAAIFDSQNTTYSYALFADGTYRFGENLFLTLGGRYSWDNPQVISDLYPASLHISTEADFSDFTSRAVLRYEFDDNSNIYASFTQGYKAGALPASSFSTVPIEPETIDAFEVGYKLFNGPVRLDVAAFFYDYQDIQVTSYGAGGASVTVNAAGAESYGIDGQVSWDVTPSLTLTLNGGYTNAEYTEFPNATGFLFDPAAGTITNVLVDASGSTVPRTPEFSGNFAVDYRFGLAGGEMKLNGNLFYTGDFFFDAAHQLPQDAYTLLNLRATWTDPSERFDLSVFGTNVTDEEYFVSSFIDPYAARAVYGDPSFWGASVTMHFN
ncbi:MAG: TonB-dependent receptor [Hyphomonadaceae bacterium]|nr:TonB-dependent receptor [Hyphomonadaceae bacterium]